MKVKIDFFLGGGWALRIFLTEKGAAYQISLRNTDLYSSFPLCRPDRYANSRLIIKTYIFII